MRTLILRMSYPRHAYFCICYGFYVYSRCWVWHWFLNGGKEPTRHLQLDSLGEFQLHHEWLRGRRGWKYSLASTADNCPHFSGHWNSSVNYAMQCNAAVISISVLIFHTTYTTEYLPLYLPPCLLPTYLPRYLLVYQVSTYLPSLHNTTLPTTTYYSIIIGSTTYPHDHILDAKFL